MANDISGTVAALVIANYCSARKTRWIGMGMFIVVIATIIPASTTLFAEVFLFTNTICITKLYSIQSITFKTV